MKMDFSKDELAMVYQYGRRYEGRNPCRAERNRAGYP